MLKDKLSELERIQDLALDHTVESIDAAAKCDLDEKEGRGNRVWLTKAANESMKLVLQVERFFAMRRGDLPDNEKGKSPDQQAEEAVQRAASKYKDFQNRARPS